MADGCATTTGDVPGLLDALLPIRPCRMVGSMIGGGLEGMCCTGMGAVAAGIGCGSEAISRCMGVGAMAGWV